MKIHEQLRINRSIRVLDETDDNPLVMHKGLEFSKLPGTDPNYHVSCLTRTGVRWAGRDCTPEELRELAAIIREVEWGTRRWAVGPNTLYPWTIEFSGSNGHVTFRAWSMSVPDTMSVRRVRFRLDTNNRTQWNVLADNIEEALR